MTATNDPDYRMAAAELYRLNVERLKILQVVQADYGKWMMATLSLLHSGTLYAIATQSLGRGIANAYVPSLVGILLTLTSAFFVWTNFTLAIRLIENWTNPSMLSDVAHWPKNEGPLEFWIPATMVIAVATGIASGGCLIWAATTLVR